MVSFIGESEPVRALRREIAAVARSHAHVLIVGETGVGKEVVAREIHAQSDRKGASFVAVNCAGVPDTLLASELFGHVRGSFTGASRDKRGLVVQADGGTLFLDELGEMSGAMQGALLRFADSGEVQPVGADDPATRSNVRLLTATNHDLREDVKQGLFREDLFYRLNGTTIRVPPLRDRGDDVLLLFRHYLAVAADSHRLPAPELSPDALQMLIAYEWPGNVRELRNVTERLVVAGHARITTASLPPEILEAPGVPRSEPATRELVVPGTQAELVDVLWSRLMNGEDFWTVVAKAYKARTLTRSALASLVDRGLRETHGSYRALLGLFNLPLSDYKRLHGYLYQRRCHLPVRPYREMSRRPRPTTKLDN